MVAFLIPALIAVGSAIIAWGSVAVSNWTTSPSTIVNYPSDDVYTNSGGGNAGLSLSSPVLIIGIAALAIFLWKR